MVVLLLGARAPAQQSAVGQQSPRSSPIPSAASAGLTVEVLVSEVPGAPSHAVPGLPGVNFGAPSLADEELDVALSPGGHWVARWGTDLPFLPLAGHYPHVLLVDGQALLLEGQPFPLGGNADTLSATLGVNDAGAVLLALEDVGFAQQRVVRHDGTSWSLVASAASAVPGAPADSWSGSSYRGPDLLASGQAAYYGALAGGLFQQALVRGNKLLLRSGLSVPPGQAASAPEPFWLMDDASAGTSSFVAAAVGEHWAARVLLGGLTSSHRALLVDGGVVLEEGQPLAPGSPVTITVFDDLAVDGLGRWLASGHGVLPGGQPMTWVVGGGNVLAQTGAPVLPGFNERWEHEGFYKTGCALSTVGDWIVCGSTDAPDAFDEVLVLNGETVVCREGDAIDLDGDGALDDGVFLAGFLPRSLGLAEDGTLLALVRLRDGAGASLGPALLRLQLGELAGGGPWTDLGFDLAGSYGAPSLELAGPILPGLPVFFALDDALEDSVAWLVLSLGAIQAPFKGGTLIPDPAVGLGWPLPTGPEGGFDVPVSWPDVPGGFSFWMQLWIADPLGPSGFSATTAWRGDAP